jgi:hypothetical protein
MMNPVKTIILVRGPLGPDGSMYTIVEYVDGSLGIHCNGEPIGSPWQIGRLESCVSYFRSLGKTRVLPRKRVPVASMELTETDYVHVS